MAEKKQIRIHNKSDKPDNIILREAQIAEECQQIQDGLPTFLAGYFLYIKRNVLPMTRLAYLRDVRFFCNYLIQESDLTQAKEPREIQANIFAGEILIPKYTLDLVYNKFISTPPISVLARIFEVSISVMKARLDYLELPYGE